MRYSSLLFLILLSGCAYSPLTSSPHTLVQPLNKTEILRAEFSSALAQQGPSVQIYSDWISRIGANGIISVLETRNAACHNEAHDLGKTIQRYTQNISASLELCDHACTSACMHGVIMEALLLPPTPDGVRVTAASCATDYREGDCLHAIGHGLLHVLGDINQSIALCDSLDSARAYYCSTGVYMEHTMTQSLNLDNRFFPCDSHKYPAACFRYQLVELFNREHYNIDRAIADCDVLPDPYRGGCHHGIGNAYLARVIGRKETIAQVCNQTRVTDRFLCIEGLAERMGRYEQTRAESVCSALNPAERHTCTTAAENKMYSFHKNFTLYTSSNPDENV